jgi:hypothetical protein
MPRQGSGGGTGVLGVLAMAAGQMGPAVPTAGPGGCGSGLRARPRKEELDFLFSEILFGAKTNLEKCFMALKVLRKSQKF